MTTDRERFEAAYQATRVPILGYLIRRTGSAADAADLLGEVYLTAWRRIADLPDEGEARLWLYGIARRQLANHHRRRDRDDRLGDRLRQQLERAGIDSGTTMDSALEQALSKLSDIDRELIRLQIWEGLSPAEIARVVARSPGAVRVRLHRVRAQLRSDLDPATGRTADPAAPASPGPELGPRCSTRAGANHGHR